MKKRKLGRKLLSFLLSFAMVVGLMPGMSLTTYAATETYTALKNNATVVHFHNSDWYIIEDDSTSATEGTVTLLSADESFGMSVFNSEANNSYNASAVKAYLDKVVAGNAGEGKPDFSDVADAIKPVDLTTYNYNSETEVKETTDGAKLYLLDIAAARNLHNTIKNDEFEGALDDSWWLRSPGYYDGDAVFVRGASGTVFDDGGSVYEEFGVRPTLKLNLSSVIFTSESNTFSLKPAEYILYEDVEKSTGSSYEHHHHICEHGHIFNYHVFQEPTTETDGYAGWVCDRCGIQDPDHADYVGPTGYIVLSAFPVFNDTLEKNIAAAPENGTVSISTKRWMSVRRGVLEALAARPDVTLSISFVYEGSEYELTMKGSDPVLAEYLASGDLFFGFIYLGDRFGLGTKAAETTTP